MGRPARTADARLEGKRRNFVKEEGDDDDDDEEEEEEERLRSPFQMEANQSHASFSCWLRRAAFIELYRVFRRVFSVMDAHRVRRTL